MPSFARHQRQPQQAASSQVGQTFGSTRTHFHHHPHDAERTTGNQQVHSLAQVYPDGCNAKMAAPPLPRVELRARPTTTGHSLAQAVRTKLTTGVPGDQYEQEADRIADRVLRMPAQGLMPVTAGERGSRALRVSSFGGTSEGPDNHPQYHAAADRPTLDSGIETRVPEARGTGRPLSPTDRRFMEPRFGVDFSAIRIHTSQLADASSRAINARAFTLKNDIFFRSGEYRPGATEGRRLLAHELTHTLQQGTSGMPHGPITTRGVRPLVAQRQPAPPVAAPPVVAPPAGRAAINWLPIIHDLTPTGWGVTRFNDPVFDITPYANGGVWNCVITQADQQTHQGVRLVPGVVEVTPALVAAEASCPVLNTMITSLNSAANQGAHSGFYMLAAVQAHEDVHVTQYRAALPPHYSTLRTAVEALTVPRAANPTAAGAKAAIKALPAFTTAMATFHAADVAANNATGAHSPVAPFNTAEHGIVDPMIVTIRARRTALKCPP